MSEPKAKTPTPVERVAELETLLSKSTTDLMLAQQAVTDLTAKFQKSEGDLTARTNELLADRREHSETKLKLQTAEANFGTEKAAHDKLKGEFEARVQTEAAKIAAANGHAAATAAVAAKSGAVVDAPDKSKMTANELIAGDIKAANTR
jgi:hypothetical protein